MERKKRSIIYLLPIFSAVIIVCFVAFFYVRQMNRTISDNIIGSISEIAEHDKVAIQAYIDDCWEELDALAKRFESFGCKTIEDVERHMNLECASCEFNNLYLVAEDGTVYSDKYVTYTPNTDDVNQSLELLSYFKGGKDKVFVRFDDKVEGEEITRESILYGVRLNGYEVDGVKIAALMGTRTINSIQDNMVIDSFIKNGKSRGHSALIDGSGNYIVNINKEIYLNKKNNLYEHLSQSESSELTQEELKQKLEKLETFGFYHSHYEEKYRELFYFIPFESELDLYFIMSVNEEVFMEQMRAFVAMSMTMLVLSIVTVIIMLLLVMIFHNKNIRIEEKAKSQKEFLSNMSHEIRTPLNGLIGMNHLIMVHIDDEKQMEQIKEWLRKSHSTSNYLLSLVNDILDMSKLQAGKVDIINEPIMVESLVDEICAMQCDNIQSRGVEFIVEKDIAEPCIQGDATRIKQILMNIVGNAAKFTPKGKSIRFSVCQEKKDENHVVTIYQCQDTGIGISKEYIGKIFDSFSQERNKNASGIKGTGLGMAISKLLAKAMGGDIYVESELDVGSTFTVRIPSEIVKEIPAYLRDHGNEMGEAESSLDLENKDTKPAKILVAEDVELNAEILLEILAMEGFQTVHAQNGKEAVEIFQNSQPGEFDIILMDMQMPVMDGCAAAKEIRRLEREDAKNIVIYACTANTFQEDRDMAIESGMNDFLTKPIDVNMLLKKMGRKSK